MERIGRMRCDRIFSRGVWHCLWPKCNNSECNTSCSSHNGHSNFKWRGEQPLVKPLPDCVCRRYTTHDRIPKKLLDFAVRDKLRARFRLSGAEKIAKRFIICGS